MPYVGDPDFGGIYWQYTAKNSEDLSTEIAWRMSEYLMKGDLDHDIKGLSELPVFIRRAGSHKESLFFTWNDSNQTFRAPLSEYEALVLAHPQISGTPPVILWINGEWKSGTYTELESHGSDPFLELEKTETEIIYHLGAGAVMPYDPQSQTTPLPTLAWVPGTETTDDLSDDYWYRSDSTPTEAENTEDNYENDQDLKSTAVVVFPDDEAPAVPYVRVAGVTPLTGLDVWDDDIYISQWVITLDIHASEFTGSLTQGYDPRSADALLASRIWYLVGHYQAMKHQGFTDSQVQSGATQTQVKSGTAEYQKFASARLDTRYPITVRCEIYSAQP